MSWDDGKAPSDVTLKELTGVCEGMVSLRAKKADLESQVKDINIDLAKRQRKVLFYLEEYGMKSFTGRFGVVSRKKNYSVKQPATPEAREAFFGYLKDKGVFDDLISVNSKTLCSYVKQEIEAAKEEGNYGFVPPGLATPQIVESISLKKK